MLPPWSLILFYVAPKLLRNRPSTQYSSCMSLGRFHILTIGLPHQWCIGVGGKIKEGMMLGSMLCSKDRRRQAPPWMCTRASCPRARWSPSGDQAIKEMRVIRINNSLFSCPIWVFKKTTLLQEGIKMNCTKSKRDVSFVWLQACYQHPK